MLINIKPFLLIFVLFSITGCSHNIRWKTPTPSKALATTALMEAQEIRDISGGDINLDNMSDLEKLAADKQQADFFLAKVNSDLTISTKGFTRNENFVGLQFPDNFTKVGITNKPTIGFAYHYKGKIKGVVFSNPRSTYSDDTRDTMVLYTEPLSPFTIIVLYQDGTTERFEPKSKKVRARFGGGFSFTPLDYFDGRLWLHLDNSRHYYVGMPYGI